MDNRLFLLDKNYILKQAQSDLRLELQSILIDKVKDAYFQHYNPLRLPDEVSEQIERFKPVHFSFFDELYDILAGVFRYQIGDNQLELLFDGKSHYETYLTDWRESFMKFTQELCSRKNFVIAALELTVFHSPEKRIELAQNRLKIACFDHFELKVYKYKGIQTYKHKSA